MTTIDERLEEITTTCEFVPEVDNERICKWCGLKEHQLIHQFKGEIKSLFLDLIAEAKPEKRPVRPYSNTLQAQINGEPYPVDQHNAGFNTGLNRYENNLKQAINGGKK